MYRFTKISNQHSRLRDDVIECTTCSAIMVGLPVMLMGKPRDAWADVRYVQTSPVQEIMLTPEGATRIITESGSVYDIEEIT